MLPFVIIVVIIMCKLPILETLTWDEIRGGLTYMKKEWGGGCTGKETVEHFSDEIMMVKASQVVWKSRTDSNGFSFALGKTMNYSAFQV